MSYTPISLSTFDPAGAAATATAAALQKASNLSDLANLATARTNLGLGTAATAASSAFDAAGAAASVGSASLQKAGNLSDVANPATARTNLGLGTAATAAASAFDAAGAAAAVAATVGILTPTRTITSGASVTVLAGDGVVRIRKATGSATAVSLESGPVTGATHVIKDAKGDASSNNITVTPASGTIDGASSLVMSTSWQSVTLVYGGDGDWSVT